MRLDVQLLQLLNEFLSEFAGKHEPTLQDLADWLNMRLNAESPEAVLPVEQAQEAHDAKMEAEAEKVDATEGITETQSSSTEEVA